MSRDEGGHEYCGTCEKERRTHVEDVGPMFGHEHFDAEVCNVCGDCIDPDDKPAEKEDEEE